MPQPADRAGNFKVHIVDYAVKKAESGAVGITLKVHLMAMYEDEAWLQWSEFDQEAFGDIWVIKKDGNINERAARSLVDYAGWDGRLESVANKTWEPKDCQVRLEANEYQGQVTYRVGFVNAIDATPGLQSIDAASAKALDSQHGAKMRALFGSSQANRTAPSKGKPPAPPKTKAEPAAVGAEPAPEFRGGTDDEVPF